MTENIFTPSKFWATLSDKNREMLSAEGIDNFKRTVANNYYNWAVISVRHGLFAPAFRHWLSHPNTIPFRLSLPEMNMLRKQQSRERIPINTIQRNIYRLYVAFAWSVMLDHDKMGLSNHLSEPETGNPFPAKLDGKLISQDLANSIIECNTICAHIDMTRPIRVAEIGAGYGRLAHVFSKSVNCEYTIFDIEPALSVAKWYLEKVAEPEKVKLHHAEDIRSFPDGYFDVVLSISTLPEMSTAQAEMYLKEFSRISRNLIFLKQWKSWKNPEDGTELDISFYDFGKNWRKILETTDPLNTKFFNAVWTRDQA